MLHLAGEVLLPYQDWRRGRTSIAGGVYLVTTAIRGRRPVFAFARPAMLMSRELLDLDRSHACEALAWVVMPDHVHLLLAVGEMPLFDVIRRLKGRSARKINAAVGEAGALWQQGFHDHALRHEESVQEAARYIVMNPVRAGLVRRVADYPFWNARWVQ